MLRRQPWGPQFDGLVDGLAEGLEELWPGAVEELGGFLKSWAIVNWVDSGGTDWDSKAAVASREVMGVSNPLLDFDSGDCPVGAVALARVAVAKVAVARVPVNRAMPRPIHKEPPSV